MLLVEYNKRKCVIFHGKPGSGKTEIARFLESIFDTHWYQKPNGKFDMKLSKEEANKSLIVMNETNMTTNFSVSKLPEMKLQFEGFGRPVENKYNHTFQGFIDAFTLVTC